MVQIIQKQPTFLEQILSSAGQGFGAGVNRGIQKSEQQQGLVGLGRTLGLSDEQVSQLGKMTPEQQQYALPHLITAATKPAPATVSRETAAVISQIQSGQTPQASQLQGKTPEEVKLILRAQETAGIQPGEEQKVFVNKNVERGQALNEKAANEENTLNILNEMENLVKSGATSDVVSNAVTEYDIKLLKPFLQTPGSKAYKTGFKELFGDFKTKFGARPTQYEAQIYEQGLPELLSSEDAKLAGIYQLQAMRQADITESQSYEQAVEEVGYRAPPAVLNKRAREIAADKKQEIYEKTRAKIFGLILKDQKLKPGESLYYNPKTNKAGKGSIDKEEEFRKSGFRRIN
jgi:hypothetical protein